MTSQEHLAEAERLIAQANADTVAYASTEMFVWADIALVHAVIALAAELGVPHPAEPVQEAHSGA